MANLYVLQDMPGKGKGLVATSKSLPCSESPMFRVPREGRNPESYRRYVLAEIEALSKKKREEFYSLHNTWPELGKELGIVNTNALPMGDGGQGGVFPLASRINHSCAQNAQNTWNNHTNKLTVHAIKDIDQGEEITLMYLGEHADYATRQRDLKQDHRFECSCERCSLPEDERRISDTRLKEIQSLDRSLANGLSIVDSPLKSLHSARRLLHLLNSEGITDSSVSRTLYDAFQIAIIHKDLARAKIFSQRSAAARLINEGHDSPEVKNLEKLVKNPALHNSHGMDSKWKTAISDIPTDLDPVEFENWLWRYESLCDIQLANLRTEEQYFPSFKDLPWDNDLSLDWYRERQDDRAGNELPIAFYTEGRGAEFSPSRLQVGNTVVIFYAAKHIFLDMTIGIRHEEPKYLKARLPPLP
ncbi:hypothetical protein IL306_013747 [Fusarium sp. DS 682]|nr:hypothetical protein IL306_013747 [Fusarium sp. DS 682]